MNKLNFKFGTFFGLFLLSVFSVTNVAWSQTSLDRLERQIRQRVGQEQPSPTQQVVTPSPATQDVVSDDPLENEESGYLGLLADDRQDRGRGVRVSHVYPDGPAAKGGLKKQDLITAVAGVRTRQMSEMGDVLNLYGVGRTVEFEILRDNKPQKVKVTLGRRPTQKAASGTDSEMIPTPPGEVAETEPRQEPADNAVPSEGSQKQSILELLKLKAKKSNEKTDAESREAAEPALLSRHSGNASGQATIEQLQKRVDELEHRVAELEKALQERKDAK